MEIPRELTEMGGPKPVGDRGPRWLKQPFLQCPVPPINRMGLARQCGISGTEMPLTSIARQPGLSVSRVNHVIAVAEANGNT